MGPLQAVLLHKQDPMPCCDQSVSMQVGLLISNDSTPFFTRLIKCVFDVWNASSKLLSQWNFVLGLISSLNGSITDVLAWAQDTWLTKPNQDLASVRLVGVGKFWMALSSFVAGATPDEVISKPANSTFFLPNLNLSQFNTIPFLHRRINNPMP